MDESSNNADFGRAARMAVRLAQADRDAMALAVLRAAKWPSRPTELAAVPVERPSDLLVLGYAALRIGWPQPAAILAVQAWRVGAGDKGARALFVGALGLSADHGASVLLGLWTTFPDLLAMPGVRDDVAENEGGLTSLAQAMVVNGQLTDAARAYAFLAEAGLPAGWRGLANTLWRAGQGAEAEAAFRRLLDWPDGLAREPRVLHDFGAFLLEAGRLTEARPLLERAAAALGDDGPTLAALGRTLIGLGEPDEGRRLIERGEWLAGQHMVIRESAAFGEDLLGLYGDGAAAPARRAVAPWPAHGKDFADYRRLAARYVLRNLAGPSRRFGPEARVFTFGSCFAGNIAANLRKRGIRAYHTEFLEDINTTWANRYLAEWLARGPVSRQSRAVELCYGPEAHHTLRVELAAAELVIMTVGVAPALFDARSGEPIVALGRSEVALAQTHLTRTSTVAENVANLRAVLEDLRRINPGAEVFLTLSPIPLKGTVEMSSAVIADCVSKSVLRVALHEVLSEGGERLHYWPSFEIVRWLGAHLGEAIFEDDGRHVREHHLDMIMDLFHERFFQAEAGA